MIGPKTWDRIIGNYLSSFGQSVQTTDCFGAANVQFCAINYALMCIRPEMAMNFGFHEVESMLDSGREH